MNDISQGIDLFNEADFFAAHDFFEDLWIDSQKKDKLFFQGLVHVSVASFHLVSGNKKGAFSQFSKGKNKLEKYLPEYQNLDLSSLVSEVSLLLNELEKGNEEFFITHLKDKLPKIKYVK